MFIQNTSILWENRRTCPSIDNLLSQLLYTLILHIKGTENTCIERWFKNLITTFLEKLAKIERSRNPFDDDYLPDRDWIQLFLSSRKFL